MQEGRAGMHAARSMEAAPVTASCQDYLKHANRGISFALQLLLHARLYSGKSAPLSSSSSQLSWRDAALLPVVSASIAIQFDMA